MVVLELLLKILLYPLTKPVMGCVAAAALRGDRQRVARWLAVWSFVHAPVAIIARLANYSSRRAPFPWERALATYLWQFHWYRETLAYCVANPFPFTERPWPSFLRNGTPYYAVEYYWQIFVAHDWPSAQDSRRDAEAGGWSIHSFRVERNQWQEGYDS